MADCTHVTTANVILQLSSVWCVIFEVTSFEWRGFDFPFKVDWGWGTVTLHYLFPLFLFQVPSDSSHYNILLQNIILMKERSVSKLCHLSNTNSHCQPISLPYGNLCVLILLFSFQEVSISCRSWNLGPTQMKALSCEHGITGNTCIFVWHVNKALRRDLPLHSQLQTFQWHSCHRWLEIIAP